MGETTTIVVTDLVGSTALRAELGEERADVLRVDHDTRLGAVAIRHGGTLVKGTGDGMILRFAGATEALHACVALQQTIHTMGHRSGLPLAMRVGVSAGDVSLDGDDCFGTPVIEASRLCDAAEAGTIVVAELVRMLARGRGALEFTSPAELALKGLPDPVAVQRLAWAPPGPGQLDLADTDAYAGRDAELDQLARAFAAARSGAGSLVLVAGEPGIGKTRLTEEFCRREAEPAGAVVLSGGCHDGDVVSNAPFAEALLRWGRALTADALRTVLGPEAPVLLRLAPALAATLPEVGEPLPVPPEAETGRLHDALSQLVLRLAQDRPLVFVVDDLHWADAATVATLRALARTTRTSSVLLVGTYRDTDIDRRHPFAQALGVIQRETEPTRIELRGLSASAVQGLLADLAQQEVTEEFAALLAQETAGNPFFLREVVQHLVEEGQLTHDGNAWVLAGPLEELGVPAGVRDVIGRRMSRLPEAANSLLAVGALSEVALDLPVAARVAELDEASALDAIDAAIEAGIVQPTSVFDSYRFTHALFRHVLVEEMNPSRQVRAHRAIAEVMEARLGDQIAPADSAALLRHYERSAALPGADRGVDHAIAVADDAARRFALDEECAALERGIDLLLDDDGRRHGLLVRRARVLVSTETSTDGKVAAATAALESVRAHDGPEDEFTLLGRLVLDAFGGGEVESAWAIAHLADRSVLATRTDAAAAVVGYALLGEQDHLDAEHPGILRDSDERRALRDLMLALPPTNLGPLYIPVGSRAEAEAIMASSPTLTTDEQGLPVVPWTPLWVLGRHRQLAEWTEVSITECEARGLVGPVVLSWSMVARLRCVLGEHEASDEAMAKATGLLTRLPPTSNKTFQVLGGDMLRRTMRGEILSADELAPALPFAELPGSSWAGLALRAALVRSLGLEGRDDEAMAVLEPVLRIADVAPGYAPNYPLIIAHCIDALWALERTEGLDQLERNLRHKVVEPDVRYPEVDGRWSLALACALTGRIDEAEALFDQARAVLRDQGTQPLLVAVDLDQAIMHQRIGSKASMTRAHQLLDRASEAASHPAMAPWHRRIDVLRTRI